MEEDMVHYIYAYDPILKKARLFKSEVKLDKFIHFLDNLHDRGCKVTKASAIEFDSSRTKSTITNNTYKVLYEKPF